METKRKHVDIYTDGACSGNPGAGGWCAVLVYGNTERECAGGEAHTTNNRMELTACVRALEMLKEPCDVSLTTDSRYVCDGMRLGWANRWRQNGWKLSGGKPARNVDLLSALLDLCETHHVDFQWIHGHAGHPYNERCDAAAVRESRAALSRN